MKRQLLGWRKPGKMPHQISTRGMRSLDNEVARKAFEDLIKAGHIAYLASSTLVLAALLTGCFLRRVGTTWQLQVYNGEEMTEDTRCFGALSARLIFVEFEDLAVAASPEEGSVFATLRHEGQVKVGSRVEI